MQIGGVVGIIAVGIAVRWGTALHGYSGFNKPPLHGDFEAQRHWMEITVHTPVIEWYHNTTDNNLQYWGLDYPPLTAYVSWAMGIVAESINPAWVELHTSRGLETIPLKLFMRASVLAADLLVFFPALYLYFSRQSERRDWVGFLLAILNPAFILIDHGHFQYNNICLGLALLAFVLFRSGRDVIGSIFFVMALNFKQMSLYYAVPVFVFLLGSAWRKPGSVVKVMVLGLVVLAAFAVHLAPFLSSYQHLMQVITRVFPVSRGVFEDKVASFWCCISIIFKVKTLFDTTTLLRMSLALTVCGIAWPSWNLLRYGGSQRFILTLFNVSIAFFLFSFHVHEKTILFPLLPITLLIPVYPLPSIWFSLIAVFSLHPLLIKDEVMGAYVGVVLLFAVVAHALVILQHKSVSSTWLILFYLSLLFGVVIHVASYLIAPPPTLPDLYAVVSSVYCFVHFILFWIFYQYKQYYLIEHKHKDE